MRYKKLDLKRLGLFFATVTFFVLYGMLWALSVHLGQVHPKYCVEYMAFSYVRWVAVRGSL
jgi:hypothetical protein